MREDPPSSELHPGHRSGKTALVTGTNSGIGFETALGLCRHGLRVILHCRTADKAEATANRIRDCVPDAQLDTLAFDCGDLEAVHEGAGVLLRTYDSLDVLVNNAGAIFRQKTVTRDGFEAHFAVNYLAGFLLTTRLLPILQRSPDARILNTSSVTHKSGKILFEDLQCEKRFHWTRAYANSKLAVLYFTYELNRRLQEGRVTVNALDPGVVSTFIFVKDGTRTNTLLKPLMNLVLRSPEEGARTGVYLATSAEAQGVSGKYFVKGREKPSSERSHDTNIAARLWDMSERLIQESLKVPA